jgi:hypothetical protein
MDKDKFIELVKKTRKVKGKRLTKKELNEVFKGATLMEKLGAFDQDKWTENWRKEVFYGKSV